MSYNFFLLEFVGDGGGNDGGQSAAAAAQSTLEMMDPDRRAQLDKALRLEGRTFMVAAKIAYRIDCAQNTTTTNAAETAQLEADRERLMVHVYGSLERRGLLVGEPIHKILFDGERDADSLTAYTDDIDTRRTSGRAACAPPAKRPWPECH